MRGTSTDSLHVSRAVERDRTRVAVTGAWRVGACIVSRRDGKARDPSGRDLRSADDVCHVGKWEETLISTRHSTPHAASKTRRRPTSRTLANVPGPGAVPPYASASFTGGHHVMCAHSPTHATTRAHAHTPIVSSDVCGSARSLNVVCVHARSLLRRRLCLRMWRAAPICMHAWLPATRRCRTTPRRQSRGTWRPPEL